MTFLKISAVNGVRIACNSRVYQLCQWHNGETIVLDQQFRIQPRRAESDQLIGITTDKKLPPA